MILSTLSIFASIQTRSKARVNYSAEFELWNLKLSFGLSIISFILYNLRHPFDKYDYLLRKFSPLQRIDALLAATFELKVNYPFEYRFFCARNPTPMPRQNIAEIWPPLPLTLGKRQGGRNIFCDRLFELCRIMISSSNKKECAKILCAFPLHRKRLVSFRPQAYMFIHDTILPQQTVSRKSH